MEEESKLGIIAELIVIALIFVCSFGLGISIGYFNGVKDTQKEAVEHGVMARSVVSNKVVYTYIDTHKLGYEEEPELP